MTDGVSAADVAGAACRPIWRTQGAYGVNYLRYWVDEEAGKIFCLVDAPDAEAANTVHRQATGSSPTRPRQRARLERPENNTGVSPDDS